jgi:hypothetical protein
MIFWESGGRSLVAMSWPHGTLVLAASLHLLHLLIGKLKKWKKEECKVRIICNAGLLVLMPRKRERALLVACFGS